MTKKNSLSQLPNETTTLIIGGGIVGAGIFRDLSLHNIPTILIDKGDFASQTSGNSSKMLHGGIRYLENFDFKLVWEALHEKNLWIKQAPHLCRDSSFYLPAFKESKRPLWMLKIGLMLYDLLSSYQNKPHKILSSSKALEKLTLLKSSGLSGAGVYHDVLVDDAKMTIDVILDALFNKSCHARNYTELIDFKHCKNYSEGRIKDVLTGEEKVIKAQEIIFAVGPFTDQLLQGLAPIKWHNKLIPSKGSHLWLKKTALPIQDSMLLQTKDNRVIFVIPEREGILVGTTEVPVGDNLFDPLPSQEEINYLLKVVNEYFPQASVSHNMILSSFAGIRPLVKEGDESDLGKTAREHKVFQPFHNVHVIVGGKFTTFRVMGQDIARLIAQRKHKSYRANLSKTPLRYRSKWSSFTPTQTLTKGMVLHIAGHECPRTFEDLVKRRLGLSNKAHWQQKTSFDNFFMGMKDSLNEYFPLTEQEIRQF